MKSKKIRAQDVGTAFAIAGELADWPADDSNGAIRHLLTRLSSLIGGEFGYWVAGVKDPEIPAEGDILHGWRVVRETSNRPLEHQKLSYEWASYTPNYLDDPHTQAMARTAGTHRAFLRQELVDEQTYEKCAIHRELFIPLGIHDRLQSGFSLESGVEIFIGIDRNANEHPFDEHDRELLLAVTTGLGWFHRRMAQSQGFAGLQRTLTDREREAAKLLLTEKSEKQIALAMGLSRGALHHTVVTLYRKFSVSSRPEFIARWLQSLK